MDIREECRKLLEADLADETGDWVCDGGDFRGTNAAVTRHILSQVVEDGDYSNVKCWGAMEYGGEAYTLWLAGIHPMSAITDRVSQLYTDYVLRSNGIET